MKYLNIYYLLSLILIAVISCKEEHDFLRDKAHPTSIGYAPVSTNALQNVSVTPFVNLATTTGTATTIAASTIFNTELQFFSKSPIKEINLYATVGTGTRDKVSTTPYASAFSSIKKLDTLLVPYTVPSGSSGTVIKLDYEILNVNSLNVIRTIYIKR